MEEYESYLKENKKHMKDLTAKVEMLFNKRYNSGEEKCSNEDCNQYSEFIDDKYELSCPSHHKHSLLRTHMNLKHKKIPLVKLNIKQVFENLARARALVLSLPLKDRSDPEREFRQIEHEYFTFYTYFEEGRDEENSKTIKTFSDLKIMDRLLRDANEKL